VISFTPLARDPEANHPLIFANDSFLSFTSQSELTAKGVPSLRTQFFAMRCGTWQAAVI
jgi:hypothetical protein